MSLALVLLAGLIGLVVLLTAVSTSRRTKRSLERAPVAPLSCKRTTLLSAAERSYFGVLQPIASDLGLHISCKTRLADLLSVPSDTSDRRRMLNRISQKHVDFVLCVQRTMEPVLAIELDDGSHARVDRQRRDQLVDEMCAAAGLPILHVRAGRGYPLAEVRRQVTNALPSSSAELANAA
jgi:hypothetical protein